MKVLYIAGWGRSGTTILDNVLGAYASVFSVGELYFLWQRGLGQNRHCGCGEPLPSCPLWREVLDLAYQGRRLRPADTNAAQRRSVVAYSWVRPKLQPDRAVPTNMVRHTAADSGMSWTAWNLLIEDLARLSYADRHMRVRYEDFVADPEAVTAEILSFAGLLAAGTPFVGSSTVELARNHTVSGNPSRFAIGRVCLRSDDAWRREQSRRDRLVSTAATLPLLHRYGYPVVPRSRMAP